MKKLANTPGHTYILSIEFRCPETLNTFTEEFKDHRIVCESSKCELCGAHGFVEYCVFKCPECGKSHDYEWSSW